MSANVSEIGNAAAGIETLPNQTSSEPSSLSNNIGAIPEEKGPDSSDPSQVRDSGQEEAVEEEGDDDDAEECGFCLFMKAGGCRDSFIAWEKCVDDADKNGENVVEKCSEVTRLLKVCMEQHEDYYRPVIQAEKAAHERTEKELERDGDARNATTERAAEVEESAQDKASVSERTDRKDA